MRGLLSRTAALLSLLFVVPARAQDPYADFRVPDYRSFEWRVQGDFRCGSRVSGDPFGVERATDYFPAGGTFLNWFHNSEDVVDSRMLQSNLRWGRGHSKRESAPAFGFSEERQFRRDGQLISGAWSRSRYPGSGLLFFNTTAFAAGLFHQSIDSRNSRSVSGASDNLTSERSEFRDYLGFGDFTLGLGAGRLRSLNGAHDAWTIEQRLAANGRLAHPLSEAARMRLAQLSYARGGLSAAHERSSKHYWREVERILREDGALTGTSLDAYALLRLFEPWTRNSFLRRARGFTVMLSATLREAHGHTDLDNFGESVFRINGVPFSSSAFRLSQRNRRDTDEVLGGLQFEYQRPVGHRGQLGAFTRARYGGGRRRITEVFSLAEAGWEIADRWSASSTIRQLSGNERIEGLAIPPNWRVDWHNSLDYWLEDSWSVALSYTLTQSNKRFQPRQSAFNSYSRDAQVTFGIEWRPSGRFDAPGLGISERLTPGSR